jgi:tetratricopeptide (TPR) repeat protein
MEEQTQYRLGNLDDLLSELTTPAQSSIYDNLLPYSDVPEEIQLMMNTAIQQNGSTENYQNFLLDDEDSSALNEMESLIGPDADQKLFINMPNYSAQKKRKARGKGKAKKAYPKLPDNLNNMMVHANMLYIDGKDQDAITMLQKVIQERADAHEAWLTLGMIYNKQNDVNKTVQCRMMAAHLSPQNSDLWASLGFTSKELGHLIQSQYCFEKAIAYNPQDTTSLWELSYIYSQQNKLLWQEEILEDLLKIEPDKKVIKELAKVYQQLNKPYEAIEVFESLVNRDLEDPVGKDEDEDVLGTISLGQMMKYNTRMGYEELNILAGLLLEVHEYEKLVTMIKNGLFRINGYNQIPVLESDPEFLTIKDIPLEIRVKFGICRLYMGELEESQKHLRYLFNSDVAIYSELYFDVAYAYIDLSQYLKAVEVLQKISASKERENTDVWLDLAKCYTELGSFKNAIEMHENVLEIQPDLKSSQTAIIGFYEELGDEEEAEKKLMEFHRKNEIMSSSFQNLNVRESMEITEEPKALVNMSLRTNRKIKKPVDPVEEEKRLEEIQERGKETVRLFISLQSVQDDQEYLKIVKKLIVRLKLFQPRNTQNQMTFDGITAQDWCDLCLQVF